jgi:XRE family aerobic/anaerobic benzoate catabolism transcriptional regulator
VTKNAVKAIDSVLVQARLSVRETKMAQHLFEIHKSSPSLVRRMDRVALSGRGGDYSSLPPPRTDAAAQCKAIANFSVLASQIALSTDGAAISSAVRIPACGSGADAVGEYCKVKGSIKPIDSRPPPIGFPVNLRTQWNDQNATRTSGHDINTLMLTSAFNSATEPQSSHVAQNEHVVKCSIWPQEPGMVTKITRKTVHTVDVTQGEELVLANLARRIRVLRAQRGMTRKQLAAQSGVSIPYLARVEGGVGNVSLALLHKLALALNVSVETLVKDGAPENADFTIIVEFLKHQPSDVLARMRRELIAGTDSLSVDNRDRIALIGLRGAGKSTIGMKLAERLGVPFIELDKEIESEVGVPIGEVITLYGQSAVRRIERVCIERVVAQYPRVVLATGGSIVADTGTYQYLLREFYSVWLKARPEVHFKRVMNQRDARIATPALQNEALDHIHRMLDARQSLYELARATIDTSDMKIYEVLDRLSIVANPVDLD